MVRKNLNEIVFSYFHIIIEHLYVIKIFLFQLLERCIKTNLVLFWRFCSASRKAFFEFIDRWRQEKNTAGIFRGKISWPIARPVRAFSFPPEGELKRQFAAVDNASAVICRLSPPASRHGRESQSGGSTVQRGVRSGGAIYPWWQEGSFWEAVSYFLT